VTLAHAVEASIYGDRLRCRKGRRKRGQEGVEGAVVEYLPSKHLTRHRGRGNNFFLSKFCEGTPPLKKVDNMSKFWGLGMPKYKF
jgi:hypothetical protein